jgi:hypothetical protein
MLQMSQGVIHHFEGFIFGVVIVAANSRTWLDLCKPLHIRSDVLRNLML